MRKDGSRQISLKQYKFTDLFLFAVILVVFDLLAFGALKLFGNGAYFTFSMTLPITLIVMMRWGLPSVFYAVFDGVFLSFLYNRTVWQSYLSYSLGGLSFIFVYLAVKLIGKDRITKEWYFSALTVIAGWALTNITVSLVQTACGSSFAEVAGNNFGVGLTGLMSLAVGLIVIMVMRRLDGMFEDQKSYLLRLDKERRERARRDEFGDEPIEIDEETLSIINRRNDLY